MKYRIRKLCGINSYMTVLEGNVKINVDSLYKKLKEAYNNVRKIGKLIKIILPDAEISIFPDGVIYSKGLPKEALEDELVKIFDVIEKSKIDYNTVIRYD